MERPVAGRVLITYRHDGNAKALRRVGELYEIEVEICGKPPNGGASGRCRCGRYWVTSRTGRACHIDICTPPGMVDIGWYALHCRAGGRIAAARC